jgi:hypothetical protein
VARSSLQVVELYPYTLHSRPSSRRGGATPPMHAIANLPLPGGSNKPLALRFVFDRLRSLAGRPVASLAGSGPRPGWVSMLIATSDDSLASDERQSKSHRTSIFVARYMHVSRESCHTTMVASSGYARYGIYIQLLEVPRGLEETTIPHRTNPAAAHATNGVIPTTTKKEC